MDSKVERPWLQFYRSNKENDWELTIGSSSESAIRWSLFPLPIVKLTPDAPGPPANNQTCILCKPEAQ